MLSQTLFRTESINKVYTLIYSLKFKMAKYKKYRKYSRRSTQKWEPNIQEINTTTIQAPANTTFYYSQILAFNPTQVNTSVSQTFTVKNLEVSYFLDVSSSSGSSILEDIAAYIMFVPQGMTVNATYNLDHPEYIMAYQFLNQPSADAGATFQPRKIKTRLSRKLHSGDNVILLIKGNNTSSTENGSFQFHGLIRWWTKAN